MNDATGRCDGGGIRDGGGPEDDGLGGGPERPAADPEEEEEEGEGDELGPDGKANAGRPSTPSGGKRKTCVVHLDGCRYTIGRKRRPRFPAIYSICIYSGVFDFLIVG